MKSFMSTFSTANARRFQLSLIVMAALMVGVVAFSLMRMPSLSVPSQPAAPAAHETLDWPYAGLPPRGAIAPAAPTLREVLDWPYAGLPPRSAIAPAAPAVRETLDWPYAGLPPRSVIVPVVPAAGTTLDWPYPGLPPQGR